MPAPSSLICPKTDPGPARTSAARRSRKAPEEARVAVQDRLPCAPGGTRSRNQRRPNGHSTRRREHRPGEPRVNGRAARPSDRSDERKGAVLRARENRGAGPRDAAGLGLPAAQRKTPCRQHPERKVKQNDRPGGARIAPKYVADGLEEEPVERRVGPEGDHPTAPRTRRSTPCGRARNAEEAGEDPASGATGKRSGRRRSPRSSARRQYSRETAAAAADLQPRARRGPDRRRHKNHAQCVEIRTASRARRARQRGRRSLRRPAPRGSAAPRRTPRAPQERVPGRNPPPGRATPASAGRRASSAARPTENPTSGPRRKHSPAVAAHAVEIARLAVGQAKGRKTSAPPRRRAARRAAPPIPAALETATASVTATRSPERARSGRCRARSTRKRPEEHGVPRPAPVQVPQQKEEPGTERPPLELEVRQAERGARARTRRPDPATAEATGRP